MTLNDYFFLGFYAILVFIFGLPTLKATYLYILNKETEVKNFYQMLPYAVPFAIVTCIVATMVSNVL